MIQPYVHHMSPFAIQFTESFGLRWYSLAYLAGLAAGYVMLMYLSKHGRIWLAQEKIGDFVTTVALGAIIGGRLGYCLFYGPELLIRFTSNFPFWGALEINRGGMASHGGIAGLIVGVFWFARKNKIPFLHLLDLTTIGGGIGIFFGRLANFVNGELFGRASAPDFKWAVRFPQEMYLWLEGQFDPERLKLLGPVVTKAGEILGRTTNAITEGMWADWISEAQKQDGSSLSSVAQAGLYRGMDVIFSALDKAPTEIKNLLAPVLTPRHPYQLYASVLEGLLVFAVLALIWIKPRKPGVLAVAFGYTYVVGRIIGEEFRMPDANIGFDMLGLTRGQWLSVGMFFVAVGFTWIVYKSPLKEKIGGWTVDNQ